jgi:transcriptional regulator of aromatic amino acid metabolism
MFKKISAEKEIQHKYLELLVEHVRVGILSIDADEKVHLTNQALRDLMKRIRDQSKDSRIGRFSVGQNNP